MIATLVYCMVYIPTLVTWPQVALKKVVPSTSNRSWTLGRQQLDTHTNIREKYRKVASRGCRLHPMCWYFNHLQPIFPHISVWGSCFWHCISRFSFSSSSSSSVHRPSMSTSHRNNTNHCHTDITTPSVSHIITPALSPRHHRTISHHITP